MMGHLGRTAVAALATSLALAPMASADNEDYFLNELYKTHQKWNWPYGEQYIVDVGHGVCDDWAAGVSYPDEVASLAVSKQWSQRNTRYFIALATGSFCQGYYSAKIPPEARLQPGQLPGS